MVLIIRYTKWHLILGYLKSDNAFQWEFAHRCRKTSLGAFISWIAGMALSMRQQIVFAQYSEHMGSSNQKSHAMATY